MICSHEVEANLESNAMLAIKEFIGFWMIGMLQRCDPNVLP